MEKELEGKVAWVTGGGRGIGRAVALRLASRGVSVIVSGRNERALGEVVGEITNGAGKARHLAGDVREEAHLDAVVEKAWSTWGRLDIVVANAGVSGRTPIEGDTAPARAILETNLLGTYLTFHAALKKMSGPGRLVAISSCLAKFGVPGYAAYCASKAGLTGLVRALAHEMGPRRITANAICPGWVDTEMASSGLADLASLTGRTLEATTDSAMSEFPLGRLIEPEEVAKLVEFLVSTAGDAITGQALSICGGSTT